MKKRFFLLFVAALLLLALIPASSPFEDDDLSPDTHFSKTYGQFFSIVTTSYDFDHKVYWIKVSSAPEITRILQQALLSSPETRAPPA